MTERLYYTDATLTSFAAHIVERREIERGPVVRLDRTAFYPTSGGQPHDTGTLASIPVVILTTSSQEEDILRSYDLGVNSYITKPVRMDGFVKAIGDLERYWFDLVVLPNRRA